MPTGHGPITTRRRLRAELRTLRLARKLSVDEVTARVEWSPSKLIRIENGQVGISVSDLTALLQLYGVRDRARVDELKELARATRQRTWWSRYQRHIPASYLEFIGAESDARRISHYHPTLIPGLLQVEPYISALLESVALTRLTPEGLDARREVRLARQHHVLEQADPPEYLALVDEAALRRPIGGAATMMRQLDHLLAMADRDNVTLVVLPYSVGGHPGLNGVFALLEYGDPLNDDVVGLENVFGGIILRDDPEVIDSYRSAAARLAGIGLPDGAAIHFIEQVRKELA